MDDMPQEGGIPTWAWYISTNECARLSALFGCDFRECKVGGTYVSRAPKPCQNRGKWTEFIDW